MDFKSKIQQMNASTKSIDERLQNIEENRLINTTVNTADYEEVHEPENSAVAKSEPMDFSNLTFPIDETLDFSKLSTFHFNSKPTENNTVESENEPAEKPETNASINEVVNLKEPTEQINKEEEDNKVKYVYTTIRVPSYMIRSIKMRARRERKPFYVYVNELIEEEKIASRAYGHDELYNAYEALPLFKKESFNMQITEENYKFVEDISAEQGVNKTAFYTCLFDKHLIKDFVD